MQNRSDGQEHGLLALLIVVVRHTRMLLIVPLVVGIATFFLGYLKPITYSSEAILLLAEAKSKQAALIMASPLVLDQVITKLNLADSETLHQAREQLNGQVRAKVGKDGLLRLEVSAATPAQAQLQAKALIDAWRTTTVPGEEEQIALQQRLVYVNKMLQSVNQLLTRLTSESPTGVDNQPSRGDSGLLLMSLGELQAKYFAESQSIPRALQGESTDVIRQQPSLASVPDPARKSILAALMTIATFLALLIGVLLKHYFTQFLHDSRNAAILASLRAALRRREIAEPQQ